MSMYTWTILYLTFLESMQLNGRVHHCSLDRIGGIPPDIS